MLLMHTRLVPSLFSIANLSDDSHPRVPGLKERENNENSIALSLGSNLEFCPCVHRELKSYSAMSQGTE